MSHKLLTAKAAVMHMVKGCKLPGLQVRHLINALNEATQHIPGWDKYSATGKATQLWDGNL